MAGTIENIGWWIPPIFTAFCSTSGLLFQLVSLESCMQSSTSLYRPSFSFSLSLSCSLWFCGSLLVWFLLENESAINKVEREDNALHLHWSCCVSFTHHHTKSKPYLTVCTLKLRKLGIKLISIDICWFLDIYQILVFLIWVSLLIPFPS